MSAMLPQPALLTGTVLLVREVNTITATSALRDTQQTFEQNPCALCFWAFYHNYLILFIFSNSP
jgi:hypothetical protein